MIKTKVAFLEGLFENFLDCSDWLDKSRPSKKPLLFWSCKQAIHEGGGSGKIKDKKLINILYQINQ